MQSIHTRVFLLAWTLHPLVYLWQNMAPPTHSTWSRWSQCLGRSHSSWRSAWNSDKHWVRICAKVNISLHQLISETLIIVPCFPFFENSWTRFYLLILSKTYYLIILSTCNKRAHKTDHDFLVEISPWWVHLNTDEVMNHVLQSCEMILPFWALFNLIPNW